MKSKLGDDDRRAVDLLLDRHDPRYEGVDHRGSFMRIYPVTMWHRVQSVEKILQLLAHLPTEDPPADLAQKTLRRLRHPMSPATPVPARPRPQHSAQQRPLA